MKKQTFFFLQSLNKEASNMTTIKFEDIIVTLLKIKCFLIPGYMCCCNSIS